MSLTKEIKSQVFDIMQSVSSDEDVSYVRMLLELRVRELDALKPRGMNKPSFFSLGGK